MGDVVRGDVWDLTHDEIASLSLSTLRLGEDYHFKTADTKRVSQAKPLRSRQNYSSESIPLLDTAPVMFIVTDGAIRISRASERLLAWLGRDRTDVVGSQLLDLVAKSSARQLQPLEWKTAPPVEMICQFITGDGRVVSADICPVVEASDSHGANRIVIFVSPRQSDDALESYRMKSYRLQSCLEGTNAGTWEWNVQTGETRFNDRWAEIVGYRLEELGDVSIDTWLEMAHPEDLERSNEALERHWNGETEFYDIEARMRHRDGHWVWVHDRGRVFTWSQDGKPEWMFGTHFSLDEQRKKVRDAERMQRLLDRTGYAASVGGWELDLETDELLWTAETRRIHGVDDDYVPSVAKGIDFYAPEARATIAAAVREALENGTPWDLELPFIRATGERIWVRAIGEVEFQDGELKRIFGVFQDITTRTLKNAELLEARAEAEAAQERLWSAIECIPEAFVLFDSEDRLVMCNGKYRSLYNISAESVLVGEKFESTLRDGLQNGRFPEATGREEEWIAERLHRHKKANGVMEERLSGGKYLQMHEVNLPNGDTVGLQIDITEIKQQESALLEKANDLADAAITDPMTGLLNRRGLSDYIAGRTQEEQHFGVLHIDLDRFKPINDVFGHAAGDFVLQSIAEFLRQNIRATDCAARVGGDEFILILDAPCTEEDAQIISNRIIEYCGMPMVWRDKNLRFGASVGIAIGAGCDLVSLVNDADIALYEAKRAGRNRLQIFNGDLRDKVRDKKLLCDEFLEALERDEIVAYYQPQLCSHSGALVALEALARWDHPTRGMLAPSVFLSIADELGQLSEVDARVFHHGIETGKAMLASGLDFTRLSFNMSLAKLTEADTLSWISDVGDLPFQISLEVLETLDFDQNLEGLASVFKYLRAHGVGVEIDDFGTGRASLTSLLRVKPDRIKIDGQITRAAMQAKSGAGAMLEAISGMCKVLGIPMTAEGVECEEQAMQMRHLGCDLLQGYHLSKPLSRDEILTWSKGLPQNLA